MQKCYNLVMRLFFLILIVFIGFSNTAYAIYEVKDEIYYMTDDNKFSDEEKDQEATYIYARCQNNALEKIYYNCECVAGAFRTERDRREDFIPQDVVYNSLFTKDIAPRYNCANDVEIAGDAYQKCMTYSKVQRKRKGYHDEYCSCVANKMARNFKKEPQLRMSHISDLRVDAMLTCD